jgi:hypothetical protein
MSYSMILSIAAVEAFTVLLLWTALMSRRLPRLARPFLACVGVAAAYGVWALVLLVRGPGWMVAVASLIIGLGSATLALAIYHVTREEEEGGGGGDVGGGPDPQPEPPRDGGGDPQPAWWPEFERKLAAYVAARERERAACAGARGARQPRSAACLAAYKSLVIVYRAG